MVGLIFDRLFALADKYHEEGKEGCRTIVRDCIKIVDECYQEFEKKKVKISGFGICYTPTDEVEKLAAQVPGIKIFTHNGKTSYELDGRNLYSANEVMRYLIDSHTQQNEAYYRYCKEYALDAMNKAMHAFSIKESRAAVFSKRPHNEGLRED